MQTVSDILDALGGPASVARDAKVPLTTVIGWRDANFVPEWRRSAIISLAARLDNPITADDFPPVAKRISRKSTPTKPIAHPEHMARAS